MHVMIDLETLSTRPDAAIMQVAAVAFEPRSGGRVVQTGAFNSYVDLDSCFAAGMTVEHDTVMWWLGQTSAARDAMLKGTENAKPISEVLEWLTRWPKLTVDGMDWSGFDGIWAKPTSFDLPILKTAFKRYGMEVPWDFRKELDMRTLFRSVNGGKAPAVQSVGVDHDALSDCFYQVSQVQTALGVANLSL